MCIDRNTEPFYKTLEYPLILYVMQNSQVNKNMHKGAEEVDTENDNARMHFPILNDYEKKNFKCPQCNHKETQKREFKKTYF